MLCPRMFSYITVSTVPPPPRGVAILNDPPLKSIP